MGKEENTMNIISYSGGADSTAVLVYCRENNVPYEEVVYMEDWFPYPGDEMQKYFEYIQDEFSIKITKLECNRKYWVESNNNNYPRLPYPYCCRVKSQLFAGYCKEQYGRDGITIIMGIRRAESYKRKNYQEKGDWFWNKRFGTHYKTWYPIFKFIDAKHYCNIHGVKINPLYDIYGVRRLGCYKCYKVGDFRWKPVDEQQKLLEEWIK
jgi:3'-phosphoadenosine 5'-phosphosulfate sulfotransferase (PAPS reductase)/FAD synthetase